VVVEVNVGLNPSAPLRHHPYLIGKSAIKIFFNAVYYSPSRIRMATTELILGDADTRGTPSTYPPPVQCVACVHSGSVAAAGTALRWENAGIFAMIEKMAEVHVNRTLFKVYHLLMFLSMILTCWVAG
jgi:hypothetical protein